MSLDGLASYQVASFASAFERFRSEPSRIRLWIDRISKLVDISKQSRWLDIGCGTGRFTIPIAKLCRNIVGLDKDREMLSLPRRKDCPNRVEWVLADGLEMPFLEEVFDFALLSMVLEHVTDKPLLLSEVTRVLKERGKLVIRTCSYTDLDNTTWYRYFPEALRIEKNRMPDVDYLCTVLASLGLRDMSIRSYVDTNKVPGDEFLAKIRSKAYTALWQLREDDFDKGVKRAEADIERGTELKETIGASLVAASKE